MAMLLSSENRVIDLATTADNAFPAYSSPWWLNRLGKDMDTRTSILARLQHYYDGVQPLAVASDKFREAFGKQFVRWSDNACKLVIQALEERLTVQGFNFGDDTSNRKAWRLWQANNLDAQSQKAHRETFMKGDCSVIVAPAVDGVPVIRVQKPEEVIVAWTDDPLVRAVAMKRWDTPDGFRLATLYYPDRVEKYVARRGGTGQAGALGTIVPTIWDPRSVPGEDWPLQHDFGVVPVVPLLNDPNMDNQGTSELNAVLPLQDALNILFVQLLVSADYASFRQRWATGLEIPTDPDTGKPVEPFKAAVERIWSTAAPEAKFGDFEQTDLSGIISAIETTIQHIATITRTPAHYLLGSSGAFPSGESLRSTETGLVAKAKRRMRDLGEGWEEIMRLAFTAVGDAKRAGFTAAETIWKDPEYRTEAEHVDALTKLASIGVPEEQLWADAGYSPTQIEAFLDMRDREPAVQITAPKVTTVPETDTGPAVGPQIPPTMPGGASNGS